MGVFKSVNILYAVSFLDLLAVSLIFPLFSPFLRDLGASHFTIGLVGSTYAAVQVLSGPLIGGWSDVRNRKSVLRTTLVICSILYFLSGQTRSVFLLFLIKFLLGIVKHTQTICKALIIDSIPPSETSSAFGKSTAYGNLGFIIGPLIGGYLSEFENGFTHVCTLTSLIFIVNITIASCLPDIPNKKELNANESVIKNVLSEFRKTVRDFKEIDWKLHWSSFLLRFFFGLCMTAYFSNQALYLKERYDLSQKEIGYCISFYGFIGMFSAFFLGYLDKFYKNDHFGYLRLYHFFLLLAICYFFIYISPNVLMFVVLLIPLAVSSTVLRVVSMDLMMKKCDTTQRGSFSGASNSVMSVARFVSPMLSGLAVDYFGQNSVIISAALPGTLAAVICFVLRMTEKTKVQ